MILIDFSAFFYSIFTIVRCACLFVVGWSDFELFPNIPMNVRMPRVQRWEILETGYVMRIRFLHKLLAWQEIITQFFADIFMVARMLWMPFGDSAMIYEE